MRVGLLRMREHCNCDLCVAALLERGYEIVSAGD